MISNMFFGAIYWTVFAIGVVSRVCYTGFIVGFDYMHNKQTDQVNKVLEKISKHNKGA